MSGSKISFLIALAFLFLTSSAQAAKGRLCYEYANIGCADTEDLQGDKLINLSCIDLAVLRQRIIEQQWADEQNGLQPNRFLIRNLALVRFAEQVKRCNIPNPNY